MAMSHKAYAFDWRRFELELRPLLEDALIADDSAVLEAFIDSRREALADPYEGDPLPTDWRAVLENRDVHEYGDYALTLFYDPSDDCGIQEEWGRVSERLPESASNALLGFSVGSPYRVFDPGRCGSYFQTPEQIIDSLTVLKPLGIPELAGFIELLEQCAADGRGVYVTF